MDTTEIHFTLNAVILTAEMSIVQTFFEEAPN